MSQESKPAVTAEQIARAYKDANPGRRYAHHDNNVVGVWVEKAGRFVGFLAKAITGQWIDCSDTGLPWVNGKPPVADDQWIEV